VKRSGRDEPIGVAIHMCMETTQGNSLCSYIYLKVAKHHVSLFIFYVFFFYKIGEQEGGTGSGVGETVDTSGRGKWQEGEYGTNYVYTCM
jgi:hypothetical protein